MTSVSSAYEMAEGGSYPFGLTVDGPQEQNRLSVLLRLLYVIPQIIFMALVGIVTVVITLIAWVVILVTGKYPQGMANFAMGSLRMTMRVHGYGFLLTDKYPPFSLDEDSTYPIRTNGTVQIDGRNRLTVLFRILLIIPHAIIVSALNYVAELLALIAWVIALFTGSVPAGIHNFLAGWLRWTARYFAYGMLLTDEYPPFSLS